MRRLQLSLFLIFFLSILLTLAAAGFAGPPSLTDDPEPVDFKHWEAYLFSTVNTTGRQTDACLHKSAVAGAFLDGVIMASLALMASVTWSLGRDAVIDLPAALLF